MYCTVQYIDISHKASKTKNINTYYSRKHPIKFILEYFSLFNLWLHKP